MRDLLQRSFHRLASQEKRDGWYEQAPMVIKGMWDRLNPQPYVSPEQFYQATPEDIYYCYRLLLKREPTAEEYQHWLNQLNRLQLTLDMLTHEFLHGNEFLERQEQLGRPYLVDLGGFKLYVRLDDFFTGAVIARVHAYEPHVTAQVKRLLQPGDFFVDIGANVGHFSMLAAHLVGPEGTVIAFEPLPANCELIRLSMAENQFDNIRLYPYAVAEQAKMIEMLAEGTQSNARLAQADDIGRKGARKWPIEAVVLDDFLAGVPRIDLVKLDIEGAEPRAWRGMKELIQSHRPYVITEFFPDFIRRTSQIRPQSFLEMLQQDGYDLFVLASAEELPAKANSISEIMAVYQESGWSHLDLFGCPREKIMALPYTVESD
jgi:FkbM family methyltransferase